MNALRQRPRSIIEICVVGSLLSFFVMAQVKHLAPPHNTVPRQNGPYEKLDECCFHRLFSNEHVRVLRLRMTPHQSTEVDRRSYDYLIIPLQYANMQTTGPSSSFDFEMRAGQMQIIKGGWPHRTVNVAESALDVFEFEITRGISPEKAVCGLGRKACSDSAFGKDESGTYEFATLFETPVVKLRKIELGPGATLAEHRHAGAEILLAATSTDLINNEAPGGATQVHLDPDHVQWFAPGMEHSVHNTSTHAAQFYELEWK